MSKGDTNKKEENEQGDYQLIRLPASDNGQEIVLEANISTPRSGQGIVIFAHGSGSSRHSPRNRYVAQVLQNEGIATLLTDLLTDQEEEIDMQTRHLRFDIGLLSQRLSAVTYWFKQKSENINLKMGYFGASTGAAAALVAAAKHPHIINAIVSRGGRPDLAGIDSLQKVQASTLLIVGGNDFPVIDLNKQALDNMHLLKDFSNDDTENRKKKLVIVPGATHLFEESGKLEEVARIATKWFATYLK
jgi:putative phosphoribosyl transferase